MKNIGDEFERFAISENDTPERIIVFDAIHKVFAAAKSGLLTPDEVGALCNIFGAMQMVKNIYPGRVTFSNSVDNPPWGMDR